MKTNEIGWKQGPKISIPFHKKAKPGQAHCMSKIKPLILSHRWLDVTCKECLRLK